MSDKEYIKRFCQLLTIENVKDGAIPVFCFFVPRQKGAKPRSYSLSGMPKLQLKGLLTAALLSVDSMAEVKGIPLAEGVNDAMPFMEKYSQPFQEELPL